MHALIHYIPPALVFVAILAAVALIFRYWLQFRRWLDSLTEWEEDEAEMRRKGLTICDFCEDHGECCSTCRARQKQEAKP